MNFFFANFGNVNFFNLDINKNQIENSGILANNISGTTGGDDDPALKFNTLVKKSIFHKGSNGKLFKGLKDLQRMIIKYEKTPFKMIFNSTKYKINVLNQKCEISSQESINQAFTSFFGNSDIKEQKDESIKQKFLDDNIDDLIKETESIHNASFKVSR